MPISGAEADCCPAPPTFCVARPAPGDLDSGDAHTVAESVGVSSDAGVGDHSAGGGMSHLSCEGHCGAEVQDPSSDDVCYCDDECQNSGDCCDDRTDICGEEDNYNN